MFLKSVVASPSIDSVFESQDFFIKRSFFLAHIPSVWLVSTLVRFSFFFFFFFSFDNFALEVVMKVMVACKAARYCSM